MVSLLTLSKLITFLLCSTATNVWNAYLGGSGTNRPFGSVVLDGVDLDIEQPNGAQYYSDFVNTLKGKVAIAPWHDMIMDAKDNINVRYQCKNLSVHVYMCCLQLPAA